MNPAPAPGRTALAIALLSVALIAYQLSLMQLLSIAQWHHFASMVISVALLGFGASGTAIALWHRQMLERAATLVPLFTLLCGAAMALSVRAAGDLLGGFDSQLLFFAAGQTVRLLLTNLIFFVPFLLGALTLGLLFVGRVQEIGSLYCANLLGSGAGGLCALGLMALAFPRQLPALIGLMALAAGLLLLPARPWPLPLRFALPLTAVAVLAGLVHPVPIPLSQYKGLSMALELPGARITAERHSPQGLIQAVEAPTLRYAPGLSLTYDGPVPAVGALFVNGDHFDPLHPAAAAPLLAHTPQDLPYALGRRERVLLLYAGSGAEIGLALERGARRIVAVEPQGAALKLLGELPGVHSPYRHPRVEAVRLEPRTHLAGDREHHELIALPAVGQFGGGTGLGALQETFTLTREGFGAMWERLAPLGVIQVSAWLDQPPRAALKLAATLVEMLEQKGIEHPAAHLAGVLSWGQITYLVKREPFTASELQAIRAFSERLQFDPALPSDPATEGEPRFHRLAETGLLEGLDRILADGREAFYAGYPFEIRPATDERPFFFQFLRWSSLSKLSELLGQGRLPYLELGYFILLLTLAQMLAAVLLLVLLPLLRLGWRGRGRGWTLVYFSGLGFGYLGFEMLLIHRLVLYLGHPIYAAAVAIGALLAFSGWGSLYSSRITARHASLRRAVLTVAGLLSLYAWLLPSLLQATITLSLVWKLLFALILIAPAAFAMGLPFPLGLRLLAQRHEALLPWAWGINGSVSVLSTALATLLAVEFGFTPLLLCASGAYAAAALPRIR